MALNKIVEEQRYRKTRVSTVGSTPVVASDLNPVIDAVNALSGNVNPPKRYVAILSQTGTNAPTATVLENTLGITLTWSYVSEGIYYGTATGGFPNRSKTWVSIHNAAYGDQTGIYWTDANTLELFTANFAGTYENGKISYASVEVRVYE